jgi:hypothetical protein
MSTYSRVRSSSGSKKGLTRSGGVAERPVFAQGDREIHRREAQSNICALRARDLLNIDLRCSAPPREPFFAGRMRAIGVLS